MGIKKVLLALATVVLLGFFVVGKVEAQTCDPACTGTQECQNVEGAWMCVDPQTGGTELIPGQEKWLFDARTTEVGKRAERARQFINWVLTHPAIHNHSVFRQVWLISAMTTLFLIVLTVSIMGIGLIVAKKQDISVKVDVVPILTKAALLLIYALFSYWLVLGLIQITDIIMAFFIKLMDADKLFSIFFSAGSDSLSASENGYRSFVGYRNFDPLVNEMAKTSLFLIDVSSYTYFVMGLVIVLRTVVLWFLLIVSPFLALLMPFRLIRNIGWIWIGVFFQWAFYGPLFALFLGALTKIWQAGIPFSFNFSRIQSDGVVYPLAINILYGGPQQTGEAGSLGAALSHQNPVNTSNYIDTFAEYVISLLMLWVVMILPWWLLRIFRDYCCDGIYAVKNILMNMMGNDRRPGEPPSPPAPGFHFSQKMQIPKTESRPQEIRTSLKVERMEEIKNIRTEEISKRMDLEVKRLSDIARFETQKEKREYVSKVRDYLRNPMTAERKEDQTQFTHLKTELQQRAVRGDVAAKRLIEALGSSTVTMQGKIKELSKERPEVMPVSRSVSTSLKVSEEHISKVTSSISEKLVREERLVTDIAARSQVQREQAQRVIQSVPRAVAEHNAQTLTQKVAETAGLTTEKTREVLKNTAEKSTSEEVVGEVAKKENVAPEEVKKIATGVFQEVSGPVKPATITTPKTVSIEEYEEMRKMWIEHYTKGEVPVTRDVKDRKDWIGSELIKLDNIMNKIVSENEEVRAAGLNEVADIIPFFILGDMNIQEIAAYLKAKQAAAKEVLTGIDKESALKERLSEAAKPEEFVEVKKDQAEAAKTMEMKKELNNDAA